MPDPRRRACAGALRRPQATDTVGEPVVDLAQRLLELLVARRSQVPDTGQGDAGFGERADLDQVDDVVRAVPPVAGRVAVGLGEQALVVVDADGLDRHPDVPGQLPDGDHPAIVPLDPAPGAGLQHGRMTNMNVDRETLRELADAGNETALDRLADLADSAGDLGELSELLDEDPCVRASCSRDAQRRPATCASCSGSDAGYDEAGHELDRLLKAPADEQRD